MWIPKRSKKIGGSSLGTALLGNADNKCEKNLIFLGQQLLWFAELTSSRQRAQRDRITHW